VFGLSTDYQVFLLSRIQEEWHTHHDNTRAVHNGTVRVSGIITSAATIMIAVFGSFVLSGQRFLQEIGVGLAVAVAIDAFLIRFMLVPAVMHILGPRNWWLPSPLAWLPRVHLDPAESPTDASAPRLDVTGANSLAQRPAVREDRDTQETLTTAGVPIDDSRSGTGLPASDSTDSGS
jgi:RND superfamily putative drug exporter